MATSTSAIPTDLPHQPFSSAQAFETYLTTHHLTSPGLYILHAKKASGIASITYPEAVELCLRYGWIDGIRRSYDATYFLQRYTPRRKKSIWSAKNVKAVEELEAKGLMMEEGRRVVEEAKADGRWERAYGGVEVPADLREALEVMHGGVEKFEGLGREERYKALMRISIASEKTRPARIQEAVEMVTGLVGAETDVEEQKRRSNGKSRSRPQKTKRKEHGMDENHVFSQKTSKRKAADIDVKLPTEATRRSSRKKQYQPKTGR